MTLVDTLKAFFLQSGAAWILWFLLALALACTFVAIERFMFFRGRGANLAALARDLETQLAARDLAGARKRLEEDGSVAAAVALAGLRVARLGPASAEKAMQGASAVERERLEARLAFMGTLGNNAPFVGLFGTVIGVIAAFEQLGMGSAGQGQAVSSAVMAGIAEALIATAVGIGVALPAVAGYNYFQRRIAGLLSGTEAVTSVLLAYLLADAPEEATTTNLASGEAPAPQRKLEAMRVLVSPGA